MPAFPVTVNCEHLDACLEAANAGTPAAWEKALRLPVSQTILAHAGVDADKLSALIAVGLSGDTLPQDMPGYLARKALRTGDMGFVRFTHAVRPFLRSLVEDAKYAAVQYLPEPLPNHVVARFAGFAMADAFQQGGPIVNLGDFYFGVYQKIKGDEPERMSKTLGLLRRVVAHELHHTGLAESLHFPQTPNSEWLLKLIVSEGTATLLMLPFTEDDSYYFTNWQRHVGKIEEYLAELPEVLAASRERVPEDVMQRWVMNVGACYYTGATMARAIEESFGRDRLVQVIVDVGLFLDAYDAARWRKDCPD